MGLLVALAVYRRKREDADAAVDHRTFYVLGLCFLPMGLVFSFMVNLGFIGIAGLGAACVGLKNCGKWKK